jgi:hypothetical protein
MRIAWKMSSRGQWEKRKGQRDNPLALRMEDIAMYLLAKNIDRMKFVTFKKTSQLQGFW